MHGPQHDEDGDQWMDACDNCPATHNVDQANSDGDDLGDTCDPYPGMQRRILFDGFATLENTWRSIDLWFAQNDAATPPMSNANHNLWEPARGATGLAWHVEVGFTPPLAPQQAVFVGVQMMTAAHSTLAYCQLHYNGTSWDFFVTNGLASVPPPSGKVALRPPAPRSYATTSSCRHSRPRSTTSTSSRTDRRRAIAADGATVRQPCSTGSRSAFRSGSATRSGTPATRPGM